MPNAQYRKGRDGEYLCMAYLEEQSWYVTRAYASKGPWDVLALHPDCSPMMVQVKTGDTAYMRPKERAALLGAAARAGAMAVLCAVPHPYSGTYEGIRFWHLETMADRTQVYPSNVAGIAGYHGL